MRKSIFTRGKTEAKDIAKEKSENECCRKRQARLMRTDKIDMNNQDIRDRQARLMVTSKTARR